MPRNDEREGCLTMKEKEAARDDEERNARFIFAALTLKLTVS